jgi:hypothetical protein
MTSSFTYTTGPTTHTYLSDEVRCEIVVDGEQGRTIAGTLAQEVRDVFLRITVRGVFEPSGAGTKSPNQIWLDLLAGSEVKFRPDTSGTDPDIIILPDLEHNLTLFATRRGTALEATELRFISKLTYQPTDTAITRVSGLKPFFSS